MTNVGLPEELAVEPIGAPFDVRLRLPGSKSLTNRALLLAALAEGVSRLDGVLLSDDTRRMLEALAALGFEIELDEAAPGVVVQGQGGRIPAVRAALHLGNAGTAYRFLTAACCLGEPGSAYELSGIARMHERPIGQLVEPLRQLGARIDYLGREGYPPVRVQGGGLQGGGLRGGELTLAPTLSSQYLSALMQVGPYCAQPLALRFDGPVTSLPYVRMTAGLMRHFGGSVDADDDFSQVRIDGQRYAGRAYRVEPDASNASYFLAAAAALPGSRCVIENLGRSSLQGDVAFLDVLGRMGARVEWGEDTMTCVAPADGAPLRGVDVDLNAMPDMAQTLAALAVLAEGDTVIRNVGNLRVKETDRLAALECELSKLGATVSVEGDDLYVVPPADGCIRGAAIDTYDDHRMAMSFAVIGLARPGVTIREPACVAKTFPDYFDYLDRLRAAGGGR